MKTRISIVTFLIITLIGAFYLKSHSQSKEKKLVPCTGNVSNPIQPSDTFLIGDETTLNYGKAEAIIHTTNKSVFDDIYKTHNSIFKRYTIKWEKDGKQRIKHYRIYLENGDAAIIYNWAKTNL